MDFDESEVAQYAKHWTGGSLQAPRALRGALLSLAANEPVMASYLDYHFVQNGVTDWLGVWLLDNFVVKATARGRSYGDAPWDYAAETRFPLEGPELPIVHATLFRVSDLTAIEIVEQSTRVNPGALHTNSKYRVAFRGQQLSLPLEPRSEDGDSQRYEDLIRTLRSLWLKRDST